MDFEIVYYDVAVQDVSHYITECLSKIALVSRLRNAIS